MFKTAKFKIHNPSRHKMALVSYALKNYHLTLKSVLERALDTPNLSSMVTVADAKGRLRIDKAALERMLYPLAPKGWSLSPLRDYLVGDVQHMILSHLAKNLKGNNESNPPTVKGLGPLSDEEQRAALMEFVGTVDFPMRADHAEAIGKAAGDGQPRLAKRLEAVYSSRAVANAIRNVLCSLETPLPLPITFTRCGFERGFLLARKGGDLYLLVRLFGKGSSRFKKLVLDDGFINCRTHEVIGGKAYPGLVFPLEMGREFHEEEYISQGVPKSAKLMIRRNDEGADELYAHISFEFTPKEVKTKTFLGIDRGAAMIGAATVIDAGGTAIRRNIDLEGSAFIRELNRFQGRITDAQRKGRKVPRLFRVRKRWADIVIGEYANMVVASAMEHRSQIVMENINAISMARFLSHSQFRKLHSMLDYKCERLGLPKPIEVPAAYTSQTCAACAHCDRLSRPKKDEYGKPLQNVFRCTRCGYSANADQNASEIIALRGLHQEQIGLGFRKFPEFQEWMTGMRQVRLAAVSGR